MSETYEPIDEDEKKYRDEYLREKQILKEACGEEEKDRETELEEIDERMHDRLDKAVAGVKESLIQTINHFFNDLDDDLNLVLNDAMENEDEDKINDKPLWKIEYEKESLVDGFVDELDYHIVELIKERLSKLNWL